ncbi:MAG: PKD domain-containing protein, partial [Chloroflexota bacterium]
LPPVADAGADQTVECASPAGTSIALDASGSRSPEGSPLTFTWAGPVGTLTGPKVTATMPLGEHTIALTVSDAKGRTASDTVVATVRDTKAPSLTLSLAIGQLWPPDHKLVGITANFEVSDICDPSPTVVRAATTSSEPDRGLGAGDIGNDIQRAVFRTDDGSFFLRAERPPKGPGRIYTVTYEARDASGNTASATAQVTVPQQRPKP